VRVAFHVNRNMESVDCEFNGPLQTDLPGFFGRWREPQPDLDVHVLVSAP
jgi:hypothetical protein